MKQYDGAYLTGWVDLLKRKWVNILSFSFLAYLTWITVRAGLPSTIEQWTLLIGAAGLSSVHFYLLLINPKL